MTALPVRDIVAYLRLDCNSYGYMVGVINPN